MTPSQVPMQLKQLSTFKCLLWVTLAAMIMSGNPAWSQQNTSAADLYEKANQSVKVAGLPNLADRYIPTAGNAWHASVPLNEGIKQFISAQKEAVGLVRQASRMPLGGWNGVKDPNPQKLREIKMSSRNIIALMTLQARSELLNDNPEQALDDLLSCLAMSNHVGQKAVAITKLVEIAVNQMATESIARVMPDLPASTLQQLPVKLTKLPASSSPAEVFLNERAFASKLINQQKGVYPEKSVQRMMNSYDDWADLMKLPLSEQSKQEEILSNKYAKGPFVKMTLPILGNLRTQMQLIDLRRQLLEAGVQVLLKGEEALDAFSDPHGEGSFGYSKTPNGFILRSQFQVQDKPVSLQFGL